MERIGYISAFRNCVGTSPYAGVRNNSDLIRNMNQTKTKNLFFGLIILLFIGCEGEEGPIGPTGLNSLVNISNEPSGTNCENGGIKVEVGIDNNSNGSLDTDEILSTSFVCNGVDGNTSLTSVTTEPAGANCENGGIKIDSGVDSNGDGTLDDTEITATAYVCNGIDGNNSLTKITSEAAGTNCENGGLKIDTGIDSDSDGTLDDSEITATAYVCNGVDGNNGLIKTTNESAGANCENGGIKIDSGVDSNGDGALDDTEITATAYVCNGIDGNNSLTKITSEAAGTNCENGGLKIDTGIDSDSDGTLDDSEITATAYACNGLDGNISLVNISDEAAGSNCENGGTMIESGVDDNGNGTLDAEEIDITRFICNGVDGGFDEQVRLSFGESFLFTTGTDWIISANQNEHLLKFDKTNYLDADSIIVGMRIATTNAAVTCFGELYNITDDVSIANTELSSTVTNTEPFEYTFSGNIYNDLPDYEISIGMRIRSGTNGTQVIGGFPTYIFIYRSN